MRTSTSGIFQSDVIIRTMIVSAINDIRDNNPWLVDYIFATLLYDDITPYYGKKEIDQARKWLLNNDINVTMNTNPDRVYFPCISVTLNESTEVENTLGDKHYDPSEDVDDAAPDRNPILAGPFTPTNYDPITGTMVLPDSVSDVLRISQNMVIVTKFGRQYNIIEMIDANSFKINEGTVDDFTDSVLKGNAPQGIELESAGFRETYQLGCHVIGEPVHLMYLHSLLVFALLRYRQSMLESRGFERSFIQTLDFNRNTNFDNEVIFSRFVNISGFVRQYWPKLMNKRISTVENQPLSIIGSGNLPDNSVQTAMWIGDQDVVE